MKRLKIALVCDWYLPRIGGLELHLRDLAAHLTSRGQEAHVICVTPDGQTIGRGPGMRPAAAPAPGVPVHRLDVPLLPIYRTIREPRSLTALEEILRRERFDVVHAHNAYSPLAIASLAVARKLGIPSVFTEHSVLRGISSVIFRGVSCMYPWTSWPTVLSAVSSFVADDLRMLSGRDEVYVVLNAVSPNQWQAPRPATEEMRVTGVMRFTRRKRPVDLVRMIPLVYGRLPASMRPRFTLVGDGPERSRVEQEARRLGVMDCLELPGYLEREQIRDLLSRTSVFAIPSLKEALSIVAMEARSAGLPVVARAPSGVAEVIEHGVHGFLAEDTETFSNYLVRLLQDETLRRRMGENARRNLERFSWDRAVDRHLDLYHLALSRHREAEEICLNPVESENLLPLRQRAPRTRS